MEINFNSINFYPFTGLQHSFIDYVYFAVILGGFLAFWKNFQDGCFDIMMQLSCDVTSSSHVTYTKRKMFEHTIYPVSYIGGWGGGVSQALLGQRRSRKGRSEKGLLKK